MPFYMCNECDKDLSSKASLAIFKMKFCNFGKSGESIPQQCSREVVCLAGCVGGSQSTTRKRKSSPTRKFKKARPTKQGSNHLRMRAALLRRKSSSSPTRKFKKARPTKQGSNHLRMRAALLQKETDAAEKEAANEKKVEEKKADEKKVVEPVKNPRK